MKSHDVNSLNIQEEFFQGTTCYTTVPVSPKLYQKQLTIVLPVSFQETIGLFH